MKDPSETASCQKPNNKMSVIEGCLSFLLVVCACKKKSKEKKHKAYDGGVLHHCKQIIKALLTEASAKALIAPSENGNDFD